MIESMLMGFPNIASGKVGTSGKIKNVLMCKSRLLVYDRHPGEVPGAQRLQANQSNPWMPAVSSNQTLTCVNKEMEEHGFHVFRLATNWPCWIGKLDQVPEAWLQPLPHPANSLRKLLRISTGMRQIWPKHGICKINVRLCRQDWPLRNGCSATDMFRQTFALVKIGPVLVCFGKSLKHVKAIL